MEKLASNKRQLKSSSGGYIIIEAIVGVVLASVLLTAFLALTVQATKLNRININNFKADMYLKELIEVAKDLEQSDWDMIKNSSCSLEPGCYPKIINNKWELFSGSENIDSFTRWITVEDVRRNQPTFPNYIISPVDPTDLVAYPIYLVYPIDPNTKKIIAHIKWDDNSHPPMTLEMYVYNYVP